MALTKSIPTRSRFAGEAGCAPAMWSSKLCESPSVAASFYAAFFEKLWFERIRRTRWPILFEILNNCPAVMPNPTR